MSLNQFPDRTERLVVRVLREMRLKYRRGESVTLSDLVVPLGPRAAALGSAIMAAPFVLPVSLGPLTLPASLLICLLSLGLMAGALKMAGPHRQAALNQGRLGSWLARQRMRLMATPFPEAIHRVLSRFARSTVKWKRRLSRPRLFGLVDGWRGEAICGAGLLVGALLLMVPLPLIPLGNTFPALAIVLFAVGWTERDGLLSLLGCVMLVVTLAYFAVVAWAATGALAWLANWLPSVW
ncbi:MAG: exopolysaccharide biosynthesis protein [Candidatus Sumerlaeaceae bacterium]|nr:exopolysaccharide biosynthesis protein [Candidatus Sumerlaeaceae bacterium]